MAHWKPLLSFGTSNLHCLWLDFLSWLYHSMFSEICKKNQKAAKNVTVSVSNGTAQKKKLLHLQQLPVHSIGGPGVIRTLDLLVRSQTLYPAELRSHYRTVIIIRESGKIVKLFLEKRKENRRNPGSSWGAPRHFRPDII